MIRLQTSFVHFQCNNLLNCLVDLMFSYLLVPICLLVQFLFILSTKLPAPSFNNYYRYNTNNLSRHFSTSSSAKARPVIILHPPIHFVPAPRVSWRLCPLRNLLHLPRQECRKDSVVKWPDRVPCLEELYFQDVQVVELHFFTRILYGLRDLYSGAAGADLTEWPASKKITLPDWRH